MFWPGNPTFIRVNIHKYDVRAHPADTAPGDHIIVPPAQKSEIPTGSRYDDGHDPALWKLDPGIADKTQPPSVADADDLLAVQFPKPIDHTHTPNSFGILYGLRRVNILNLKIKS